MGCFTTHAYFIKTHLVYIILVISTYAQLLLSSFSLQPTSAVAVFLPKILKKILLFLSTAIFARRLKVLVLRLGQRQRTLRYNNRKPIRPHGVITIYRTEEEKFVQNQLNVHNTVQYVSYNRLVKFNCNSVFMTAKIDLLNDSPSYLSIVCVRTLNTNST